MTKNKQEYEMDAYEKTLTWTTGNIGKVLYFFIKIPVTILRYVFFGIFTVLITFKAFCVNSIRSNFNINKIENVAVSLKENKGTYIFGAICNELFKFLNQPTNKEHLKSEINDFAFFFSWAFTVVFALLGFIGYYV